MKETARRGDLKSARLLAKELVRTRRTTTQLYTNKAHMIGMGTQLQEQLAMVKVAGSLSKSTEVMKIINDMMKVGERALTTGVAWWQRLTCLSVTVSVRVLQVHALNQTMVELSKEMMKAGIIDEVRLRQYVTL